MTPRDLILIFGTVQRVMRVEQAARRRGLDIDVIPAPRAVSSQCGVVVEARSSEAEDLKTLLDELTLQPLSVYRRDGGGWVPSSLDAATPPEVRLTRHTAYGGCGAKLSKGALATILCGLPRLESEDLIVGIETADDAGVVRITPEVAIIHTTDFFPPMVDDPFAFGRIAAVNALSDVYAMGGTPLAGMNLVSFPTGRFEKTTLKEILRGGLSALDESGAVLAGGHTVEGQELLYGMAVTGTVHPDRIWQNGGARPGDLLVLTKPLGTGVITTAAKAEMASAESLSTAIRWMSTLNREAARVLVEHPPHAVTDVTGFGLVGHAAEMAESSGLSVEIDLHALPLIPGALEAAGMGLVPAGTGKNRESVSAILEIAEDADPVLVDLALDPQTSGGLLAAVPPELAERLVRRLEGAAVVGRAVSGVAGTVQLA
ncbi:MAG: selenide, water dikinase SelD [Acidobacteria bacterium]|nr:selenide, water dikinase SelD [Acidobacteriota bacterium]